MSRRVSSPSVVPEPVWKGPAALQELLLPVGDLTPDPHNARRHNERNIEVIKNSLSTLGQRKPVVAREGVVLAGNGTYQAALALGWTHIAVVDADDLTEEQARTYSIVDNKAGDLAEWDFAELSELLRKLPTDLLPIAGFADFELEPLLASTWRPIVHTTPGTDAERPPFVSFTKEQWEVVTKAIDVVRGDGDGPADATAGRCLELICADFLSGRPE